MNLKSNKAITLVALIITIVILLILAGVTLNMVLGENGLINKAQSSVDKYQERATNEQTLLNSIEQYIDSKGQGATELTLSETSGTCIYPNTLSFTVTNNPSGGTISATSSDELVATVSVSGNTITVTPKAVGTATITVTSAETGNYNAKSKTYALTVKQKTYSIGESVTVGGYDFYVIGDDGTKVTLLYKSTIGTENWANAKSRAITFASEIGGEEGRLMTRSEAMELKEVDVSKFSAGAPYWLADLSGSSGGYDYVAYVGQFGPNVYDVGADQDTSSKRVRPVVIISRFKLP